MIPLVHITIPGGILNKDAPYEGIVRGAFQEAFGKTLGRAKWDDYDVVCDSEQFGIFISRLLEHDISINLLKPRIIRSSVFALVTNKGAASVE
jgi:hypothetical protein